MYDSFLRTFRTDNKEIHNQYVNAFGDPLSYSLLKNNAISNIVTVNNESVGGSISFTFKHPSISNLELLTFPIVDSSIWGSWNETISNNQFSGDLSSYGMGTGPFRYNLIDETSNTIQLTRNENYWNGSVQTPSFRFKYIKPSSNILEVNPDISIFDPVYFDTNPDIFSNQSNYEKRTVSAFSWVELSLNMLHPVFGTGVDTPLAKANPGDTLTAVRASRYMRQAISELIPRKLINDELYHGEAKLGITPWFHNMQYYNIGLKPYPYSIAGARELQLKAGYDTTDRIPPPVRTCPDRSDSWLTSFLVTLPISIAMCGFKSYMEEYYKKQNKMMNNNS